MTGLCWHVYRVYFDIKYIKRYPNEFVQEWLERQYKELTENYENPEYYTKPRRRGR